MKRKAGMSLVEVILAMALVSIIVIMSMPIFITTSKYTALSGKKTHTTYNGISEIEKIKAWAGQPEVSDRVTLENKLVSEGYLLDGGVYKKEVSNVSYVLAFIEIDSKEAVHLKLLKENEPINELYYILYF